MIDKKPGMLGPLVPRPPLCWSASQTPLLATRTPSAKEGFQTSCCEPRSSCCEGGRSPEFTPHPSKGVLVANQGVLVAGGREAFDHPSSGTPPCHVPPAASQTHAPQASTSIASSLKPPAIYRHLPPRHMLLKLLLL